MGKSQTLSRMFLGLILLNRSSQLVARITLYSSVDEILCFTLNGNAPTRFRQLILRALERIFNFTGEKTRGQ